MSRLIRQGSNITRYEVNLSIDDVSSGSMEANVKEIQACGGFIVTPLRKLESREGMFEVTIREHSLGPLNQDEAHVKTANYRIIYYWHREPARKMVECAAVSAYIQYKGILAKAWQLWSRKTTSYEASLDSSFNETLHGQQSDEAARPASCFSPPQAPVVISLESSTESSDGIPPLKIEDGDHGEKQASHDVDDTKVRTEWLTLSTNGPVSSQSSRSRDHFVTKDCDIGVSTEANRNESDAFLHSSSTVVVVSEARASDKELFSSPDSTLQIYRSPSDYEESRQLKHQIEESRVERQGYERQILLASAEEESLRTEMARMELKMAQRRVAVLKEQLVLSKAKIEQVSAY
jgi:hypothetical protein